MAKAKSKNRLDQLKQLEKEIRANPALIKDLIADPEKTVAKFKYLDEDLRANMSKFNLMQLLTGMTGIFDQLSEVSGCGDSSCGSGGTCSSTCSVANSCSDTCRTSTCSGGPTIAINYSEVSILDTLIQYSHEIRGLDQRVFTSFRRNISSR